MRSSCGWSPGQSPGACGVVEKRNPEPRTPNPEPRMHALTLAQPGRFEPRILDAVADPRPGEAIVATHQMGVCGTDLGGYLGKMPFFSYPRIIGHELGVEVVAVGDGVTNVTTGDRCCVRPYVVCGECYACRRGAVNCCVRSQTLGVMCDGGLRERFAIDASLLHPSGTLDYEQLALVETLGIGCHAVDRAGISPGDDVLIVGVGPIGLSALEFAKLAGGRITVMDLSADRLARTAATYGLDRTINPTDGDPLPRMRDWTGGDLYPVVIDATGHAGSMATCPHYLAQTGTLVYVGIAGGEVPLVHSDFHKPEATIKASRNALPRDFARIIELIETGQIDTQPWITHRIAAAEVAARFGEFTDPEAGVVKAMVRVADGW